MGDGALYNKDRCVHTWSITYGDGPTQPAQNIYFYNLSLMLANNTCIKKWNYVRNFENNIIVEFSSSLFL